MFYITDGSGSNKIFRIKKPSVSVFREKKRFQELLVLANIKELAVFVKEPMVRKVISCMFENFENQGSVPKSVIYLSSVHGKQV
jgi:hypothetical protein